MSDEIINYVMDTPSNTNPNVLKGLLDKATPAGASSLADLSDVMITEPLRRSQMLVYNEGDALTLGRFKNRRINIDDLEGISRNVSGKGITLISDNGSDAVFDYYQCAESITFDDSVTQAFEQVISMLKVSAKSSGRAGAKLSVPNAADIVSYYDSIADTHKRVPICDLGSYVFYPKGRIAASKVMFSSADTDADGVYDIIFVTDGTAASTYIAVEYTVCPAMS